MPDTEYHQTIAAIMLQLGCSSRLAEDVVTALMQPHGGVDGLVLGSSCQPELVDAVRRLLVAGRTDGRCAHERLDSLLLYPGQTFVVDEAESAKSSGLVIKVVNLQEETVS